MIAVWPLVYEWLAAHWVDFLSAIGGLIYTFYVRGTPRRRGKKWITKDTGVDFYAGLALAPLAILFIAAFSETVMKALIESSRVTLAGASVLAIFAILQEDDESTPASLP